MNESTLLLIVGIASLGLGFALGLVISSMRTVKDNDAGKEGSLPRSDVVARFMVRQSDSEILAEMDGKMLSASEELSPEHRRRLDRLRTLIDEMLKAGDRSTDGANRLERDELSSQESDSHETLQNNEYSHLDRELPSGKVKKPSMNPVNILSRALQADVRSPKLRAKSIAEQVDEILQEMLQDSLLANKGIRLMELPGKGMVVMVGLDQYDSVDSVPDEAVKQLIHAAVNEWEKGVGDG